MVGSIGEKRLQQRFGSEGRAKAFYDNQMLTELNPAMMDFISNQTMMFIATADKSGNCDNSFRFGHRGFVRVIDEHTLLYPEYRGNGVYASLGNIEENPHIGLLFIDFFENSIGLHVNGRASIEEGSSSFGDRLAERHVRITVEEAYIHCSKHIPRLQMQSKEIDFGTDDVEKKGGDFFRAKETNALLRR